MKSILTLCLIALLAFSTGCSLLFPERGDQLASELASDGIDEFKNGNYKKSIEYFEKLRDWYPFDKFAILAELKIADAHYKLQEYDEAIHAYEMFENLHPRNEAIPYVIYQIGLCHFERIDTIDRDQTAAQEAMSVFKRLIKQFPEDDYALSAQQKIDQCLKSLAGHELYVGIFYYKSKHYKAALNRFNTVISDYPDVGTHKKALEYIALCKASLEKKESEKSP